MRQLGIKTTDEILELGIEKFNEACRASVMKYTGEWRDYVTRQARWVDFDHDYQTYEPDYMESVIWAFKQLYDKGWVYEGFRVLPYCWNDETPLSNHELRMDDDVYQMRQDPAVTVGLPADQRPGRGCAGAGLDDDAVDPAEQPRDHGRRRHRLRRGRVRRHRHHRALPARRGRGSRRTRASSATTAARRSWRGSPAPSCSAAPTRRRSPTTSATSARSGVVRGRRSSPPTDGTGLVHTAGAFGEDDKIVTDREGIEAVMPVGKDGRFTAPVDDYAGHARLRREPARSSTTSSATTRRTSGDTGAVTPGHGAAAPRDLRPLLPALLALPRAADLQGRLVVVRRGDGVQASGCSSSTSRSAGCPSTSRTASSASGWRTPATGRSPATGSGARPVPVWKSDDPAYPRIDVYGSFEELERDFGRLPQDRDGTPTCTGPTSTS